MKGWVDEADRAIDIADDDRIGQAFEDRAEQRLLALEAVLGRALRAEVDDRAGEEALAADGELADREVHGEGRAVLAQPHHLAADADDLAVAGGQVLGEVGSCWLRNGSGISRDTFLPIISAAV